MIVIDTNIIAYLHIDGELTQQAINLLRKDSHWIAPPLWRSEFRNILINYVRHNVLTLEVAQRLMQEALITMNKKDISPSNDLILSLAANSSSSAYVCEFVALAQEIGCKLITGDKQIVKDFPGMAISLDEYMK
ncbi:MAG: type II toxin-antitoxin system VapC family toxin [Anaerolineales bacterium]